MKRIFVKSVNWVGDAVMATPTLSALRATFPEAHVTLLARPPVADVFERHPAVDRLWVAHENASASLFRRIAARIRDERFDVGLSLPNSFGAALLLALGRIPRRVGYARDGRSLLLNDRVEASVEIRRRHEVEYYLNLLGRWGESVAQSRDLVVPAAPDAVEQVAGTLRRLGLDPAANAEAPLVALCPGAAFGTAKRWLPERFAAAADHLVERHNARVLVVGTPSERDVGLDIARQARRPVHVLSGMHELRPLRCLIALCEHLRLLLTNDSGAMHVAAARNVPLVAVFGPTNWDTTAPWNRHAVILRKKEPCEDNPCMRRHCPREHLCMAGVRVEDVVAALDEQMRRPDPRHADDGASPYGPPQRRMLP